MSVFTVVSLMPSLLNIHGDAQNAQVLAARASWSHHEAQVIVAHSASDLVGIEPHAITIGSGFDSDATELLGALQPMSDRLHEWVAAGTPLLAVGLGWELLSESTEHEATTYSGLGIFRGNFVASSRAVGPVSLQSRWGRLVGYEYHYRDYLLGSDELPLGTVESGVGNLVSRLSTSADADRVEGAVRASAIGTTLRGPILARNPKLADDLIGSYFVAQNPSPMRLVADDFAAKSNQRVTDGLKLRSI